MSYAPDDFGTTYLRLRGDASIEPLAVNALFWERLAGGELGDFHHEYLVTASIYDRDWDQWEMHPCGDEVVCLLSGAVTFILEMPGGERQLILDKGGSFVVVPRGTWHTAKVAKSCRLLFITAGEGTQHRSLSV